MGLEGDDIPLAARIVNIADQYDAPRTRRTYKSAFDHATAVGTIAKGDGSTMPEHFDSDVLNAFIKASGKLEELYEAL